jgi:hypothetical protein
MVSTEAKVQKNIVFIGASSAGKIHKQTIIKVVHSTFI